jgi:glycosyltransferase involved in cell wall biosynthesis
MLDVPCVIKLHGSDINVLARWNGPRRRMQWALPRADRVVAVSRSLADAAVALGVPEERVDLVPNGIDRSVFYPRDRGLARKALGLPDQRLLLYVGHLAQSKGVFDLIRAFSAMSGEFRDVQLVMIGDGEASEACRRAAHASSASERIRFVGPVPHEEVPTWLAACNVLTLPSWHEGTPNVILEALASGRGVVASNVGGIPELVQGAPHVLVPPSDASALRQGLQQALTADYEPAAVSNALNRPDWNGSAQQLHRSLLTALGDRAREAA